MDWGKSTLSHHLRVLREAGITHTHVLGSRREVSLRWGDLETRFPGLLTAILAGIANNHAVTVVNGPGVVSHGTQRSVTTIAMRR